ncbi:DUF3285 domain-containing protein [Microcoleus sp. FACHB-1515]|uniref:DUF3285 domain-containing protein n=1 Tax=Cyanophyceae TaxID=3028117 RepID=UPI00168493E2|nr:DUF3285 domain-containing protein [Microcoleus sp. FACHB-1515]MBD2092302.1 DUF3285 domain-containing protein [Microcoleus sp. FACHB-1515]
MAEEPIATESIPVEPASTEATPKAEKPPSYVKLAMRNMVRKRGKSLYHFALTAIGLLAFFVGVSYLTR